MGKNFRGGYQIIDLSEYELFVNNFVDDNKIKELIDDILTKYKSKKPLMLQLKDNSIYDIEIRYIKSELDDFTYLDIYKNGNVMCEISSEEKSIIIYSCKVNKQYVNISYDTEDGTGSFRGLISFKNSERTNELISKLFDGNNMTDLELKELFSYIVNVENGTINRYSEKGNFEYRPIVYCKKVISHNSLKFKYIASTNYEYDDLILYINELSGFGFTLL